MDMAGSYDIPAPRQDVWIALNDPNVLRACIPGCESLEKLSDTQMVAAAKLAIGPVKALFKGNVTLSDIEPARGYTITGEGSGGIAGFAKGGAIVKLDDIPGGTRLTYNAKADVGGKIAQLGSRLIDGVAKKMADDFFGAFSARFATSESNVTSASAKPKLTLWQWLMALFRARKTNEV